MPMGQLVKQAKKQQLQNAVVLIVTVLTVTVVQAVPA